MKDLHIYSVDYPTDRFGYSYLVAHYSAREAEEFVQQIDESDVRPHAELIEPIDYEVIEMLGEDGSPTSLAAELSETPVKHPCIFAGGEE